MHTQPLPGASLVIYISNYCISLFLNFLFTIAFVPCILTVPIHLHPHPVSTYT
ncbi:hypothetical protein BDZ91DRAFT_750192, partial [Kalaharituber pfeilii]